MTEEQFNNHLWDVRIADMHHQRGKNYSAFKTMARAFIKLLHQCYEMNQRIEKLEGGRKS